jgi:hypothetical protein
MNKRSVREQSRFDFQTVLVGHDPNTGQAQYIVRPDPGRYEWRDLKRGRALYDRFDDVYFDRAADRSWDVDLADARCGSALGDVERQQRERGPLTCGVDVMRVGHRPGLYCGNDSRAECAGPRRPGRSGRASLNAARRYQKAARRVPSVCSC